MWHEPAVTHFSGLSSTLGRLMAGSRQAGAGEGDVCSGYNDMCGHALFSKDAVQVSGGEIILVGWALLCPCFQLYSLGGQTYLTTSLHLEQCLLTLTRNVFFTITQKL